MNATRHRKIQTPLATNAPGPKTIRRKNPSFIYTSAGFDKTYDVTLTTTDGTKWFLGK